MSVVVVEPEAEVIGLDACKAHLRVDHDDDNDLIEGLARAAEQHLSGPDGCLGRSIGRQMLDLRLPGLCSRKIRLPYGPVAEIDSVVYVDPNGAELTLDASVYDLIDQDTISAGLALKPTAAWPAIAEGENAVRIRYVAGYQADAVPAPLRQAMLLLVGHWYENREAVNVGNIVNAFPLAVDALSAPFRVWR